MFTHLVSDAGLFNYSPSACHQRAASCSRQTKRLHILRKAVGSNRVLPHCCCFLLFLVSKPRNPPQSSYVGDTKTVSHFSLPEQSPQNGARNSRPNVGLPSKPPRSQEPCVQPSPHFSCYCSLFLFYPCPLLRSPVLSSLSLPFCVADSLRPSKSWVPLAFCYFFSPCSRLWLQPLRAGSPKTHDSLTMNNQYRY